MFQSRLFKEVFEQSSVPQMIYCLNTKNTLGNKAFFEFIGYSKEEWKDLSVKDISHPEDHEMDVLLLNELLAGVRSHYQIEKRYFHKSGMLLIGTLNISLVSEPGTDNRYIFAQIIDCTEKYAIDEVLRKTEKQYRLLAENSSDIIVLHKTDGVYKYVSPSVQSILGYHPYEMIDKDPYDHIHPEDTIIVANFHDQILSGEEQDVLLTYRIKRKDGSFIWLESSLKGVYDQLTGKLKEVISISRNIKRSIVTRE
jgi:two-component system, sporulation sensor kinase A